MQGQEQPLDPLAPASVVLGTARVQVVLQEVSQVALGLVGLEVGHREFWLCFGTTSGYGRFHRAGAQPAQVHSPGRFGPASAVGNLH